MIRKLKCPFCDDWYEEFLPFGRKSTIFHQLEVIGGGYRLNSRCPGCGSLDRERLIYLYLLNQTDIFSRKCKLLHVAPETNLSKMLLTYQHIDYYSIDIDGSNALNRMDITDLNFPNNYFDAIICCHVLEHVANDKKALQEINRTMKKGGFSVLQVPISKSLEKTFEDERIKSAKERFNAFGQSDHLRIYSAADYKKRIERAGLIVEEFAWEDHLDIYGDANNYFSLIPNEIIYIAKKMVYRCRSLRMK